MKVDSINVCTMVQTIQSTQSVNIGKLVLVRTILLKVSLRNGEIEINQMSDNKIPSVEKACDVAIGYIEFRFVILRENFSLHNYFNNLYT